MFETLCRNPTICNFFLTYPKPQWSRCLEAVVLLGVASAQSKLGFGAAIDLIELEAKKRIFCLPQNNPDEEKLSQSCFPSSLERGELASDSRPISAPHQRGRHRPLITNPNISLVSEERKMKLKPLALEEDTPRFNLNDTPRVKGLVSPKGLGNGKSPGKDSPTVRRNGRDLKPDTPRKLPKYLENVKSKIRPQVQKDVEDFRGKIEGSIPQKRFGLRKSSSFGDLSQWSESLLHDLDEKENDGLKEPNVSMCVVNPNSLGTSLKLSEPNTSVHYADQLKQRSFDTRKNTGMRGTAEFHGKVGFRREPSVLSLAEQFLNSPTLMQLSNRSYHLTDLISTTPASRTETHIPEAERTAPTSGNTRYKSFTKEYEVRRNEFVRRLSSISSISSVVPDDESMRKSPGGKLATPSSRASSFPWMDSTSPNTSFYDREDVRNPMYKDSLLTKYM